MMSESASESSSVMGTVDGFHFCSSSLSLPTRRRFDLTLGGAESTSEVGGNLMTRECRAFFLAGGCGDESASLDAREPSWREEPVTALRGVDARLMRGEARVEIDSVAAADAGSSDCLRFLRQGETSFRGGGLAGSGSGGVGAAGRDTDAV